MSQLNRKQANSEESGPFGGESNSSFISSFSNGEPCRLASPSSTYSPNLFFLQRERSNSPPHSTRDFLNALPSPLEASPDAGFLSPSQPSPAVRNFSHDIVPFNAISTSPSSENLNHYSPNSAPRTNVSASSSNYGLGIIGTGYQQSLSTTSDNQEIMLNYPDKPAQSSQTSRYPSALEENRVAVSDYDSSREFTELNSRRQSQNTALVNRLSLMPPPEPIEVPTAEDVRFGIKGAKSVGWNEVRRQSILRNESVDTNSLNQGWRKSFFGKFGHSDEMGQKPVSEFGAEKGDFREKSEVPRQIPSGRLSSLDVMIEGGTLAKEGTNMAMGTIYNLKNPHANFMRPISMASDENLKMMRGDRSDMNPTTMRFRAPLNPCESMNSFSAISLDAFGASNLGHNVASPGLLEDFSIKDRDDTRLEFLPHNFEVFDFPDTEPDDALHDPGPLLPRKGVDRMIVESKAVSGKTDWWSVRGWLNALGLVFLVVGLLSLFAGFPVIDYFISHPIPTLGGFNLGGINATGQVPEILGFRGLIDVDTPKAARTKNGLDGRKYRLVFSDEFNQDRRTFWPGDDPYWEAVDLHYWATNNLEWYDPDQITTANGSLVITFDKADPALNHNLNFRGGMLQSWNQFCFTGGIIEASISLPGDPKVGGLWPAFWTMGNLGRAGYGATLDGTWPYSYDSCDVGTLPNQTDPKTGGPAAAHTMGDPYNRNELSFLPGQRFSRCTCPDVVGTNYHPGPKHPDGTWVGRSAPEIDILEAITDPDTKMGQISQSAQLAPYNAHYELNNRTKGYVTVAKNDSYQTVLNPYTGNVYQQAASGLSNTDQISYNGKAFASYGFQYATSDSDNPYLTWTQKDQAMWGFTSGAIGPDPVSQISSRTISNEPMYILLNLGMSANFGEIDLHKLTFPAKMLVDWVRVYQPVGEPINTSCSPPKYPTAKYIQDHQAAYTNPNLTTWIQYQESRGDKTGNPKTGFPKNKLLDTC